MAQLPEGEMTFEIGEIKPPRWEYLCLDISKNRDNPNQVNFIFFPYLYSNPQRINILSIDKLGEDRWELVSIYNDIGFFKRPIWDVE